MSGMYRRILLKLSGEALMGDAPFGIDPAVAPHIARQIKAVHDGGVQIGIVIRGWQHLAGPFREQQGDGPVHS